MKKYIVFCSVLAAGLFIISSYQTVDPSTLVSTNQSRQINKSIATEKLKKIQSHESGRTIASVNMPPVDSETTKTHEEKLGDIKKELTQHDLHVVNKVKTNLPNLANSEFKVIKRLKISDKSIFVVNTKTQTHTRSFTALVDNKSGRIEKSWGKTKYEFPHTTRHFPTNQN